MEGREEKREEGCEEKREEGREEKREEGREEVRDSDRDGCYTRITRGCIKQKTALQVFLFPAITINRVKMFVAAFHLGLLFSYFTQDKGDNAFFGFLVFNAS